jgi:membrane protein YqaA with SNARE-associated domain
MLLAVAGPLTSRAGLLVAVLGVTAGQVTGKCALYCLARRAQTPQSARVGRAIERWRDRYERRPIAALAVILASATFGLPPFYLTTLVAGALRIGFGAFLPAGLIGRLLHFGAIAMVPELVGGMLH